jgi:hypothetical protein
MDVLYSQLLPSCADICADFIANLHLGRDCANRFIAPGNTSKEVYPRNSEHPTGINIGRRKSGFQASLYDKLLQAVEKGLLDYMQDECWDRTLLPHEKVQRIEARFGRKAFRDWNVNNLRDLEARLADLVIHLFAKFHMVTNRSRDIDEPIWRAAKHQMLRYLASIDIHPTGFNPKSRNTASDAPDAILDGIDDDDYDDDRLKPRE